MRRVKSGIAAALLGTCPLTVACYAQDAGAKVAGADTCIALETREQMLECYEDRVDDVLQAREVDGVSDAATAEDPGDTAGEIIATITAIREIEPNAYLITLDNGQTWRQNAPKRYLLRIGAEVRLQPSTWGSSYRLTDPDVGHYIQVTRVK